MSEPRDDEQETGPLDDKWLEAWKAPEPSAGFADRVMSKQQDRWAEERAPKRRNSNFVWAAVAVMALVVGSASLTLLGRSPVNGAMVAQKRESISLGNRGIAVAEAESALNWSVARNGEAAIDQSRGNVFYRVERGEPFVVRTPAGTVEVKGTCFRVEVSPMKSQVLSAGAGAALAATVLVTVYEGRVLLANERGRAELTAGQQSLASPDRAPTAPSEVQQAQNLGPSEGATREELLVREKAQREEMARLQTKLKELEQAKEAGISSAEAARKVDRSFVEPSKDDLLQWAKECRIKWDTPIDGRQAWTIDDEKAPEYGLSETEQQAFNNFSRDWHKKHVAQLVSMYREATGDKGGDGLSPWSLQAEIAETFDGDEIRRIMWRISNERAGLVAPSTSAPTSLAERFYRLTSDQGNAFERDLSGVLGPDLAHSMRLKNNGWGSRSSSSLGCPK